MNNTLCNFNSESVEHLEYFRDSFIVIILILILFGNIFTLSFVKNSTYQLKKNIEFINGSISAEIKNISFIDEQLSRKQHPLLLKKIIEEKNRNDFIFANINQIVNFEDIFKTKNY